MSLCWCFDQLWIWHELLPVAVCRLFTSFSHRCRCCFFLCSFGAVISDVNSDEKQFQNANYFIVIIIIIFAIVVSCHVIVMSSENVFIWQTEAKINEPQAVAYWQNNNEKKNENEMTNERINENARRASARTEERKMISFVISFHFFNYNFVAHFFRLPQHSRTSSNTAKAFCQFLNKLPFPFSSRNWIDVSVDDPWKLNYQEEPMLSLNVIKGRKRSSARLHLFSSVTDAERILIWRPAKSFELAASN